MSPNGYRCASHITAHEIHLIKPQERRRIEETYAASLRKLAGKPFNDSEVSDLGYVLATP
jgi:hypothetical protein